MSASAFTIFGWSFSDLFGSSLSRGLVGHWTFDGKNMVSNVADSSGQGNTGRLILGATGNTATTTTMGVLGQALLLDGVSDEVVVGAPVTTQITNVALSAWVYWKGVSQTAVIVYNGNSGSNGYGLFVSNGACGSGSEIGVLIGGVSCDAVASNTTLPSNRWVHLVLTRDTTTWRLYLDGAEIDTGTTNPNTPTTRTVMGGNGLGANAFNGSIDDVRVYDRALSAEEVKRLYTMGAKGAKAGTAPASGTLSATGGLVGHWTFDGKHMISNVQDSSGNALHGTLTNFTATTTTIGRIGQALEFDGTNDYVTVESPNMPTQDLTIAFWAKVSSFSNGPTAIMISNGSGTENEIWFGFHSSSGAPGISVDGALAIYGSTGIGLNNWGHVAFTRAGSSGKIYLNGEEIGTVTDGDTLNFSTCPLYFGLDVDSGCATGPGNYLKGLLDDVRIYNRALSAEEVKRLYTAGASGLKAGTAPTGGTLSATGGLVGHWTFDGKYMISNVADASGSGNNGRLILGATGNTATTSVIGKLGQALSFDGINDYVSVAGGGGLNNLETGSISLWARWDGTQDAGYQNSKYGCVIGRQKDAAFSNQTIGLNGSDPATAVIRWVPYLYNQSAVTGSTAVGNGVWRHVVVTYSSGSHRLYLDGVQNGTGVTAGDISDDSSIVLSLGGWIDAGECYFKGSLDDVRVYNRILSAEEVTRLYTAGQ